ncbi:MAG TPA: L,D-transpeptidase family protein [Candidatus Tectomicrobia bacterium]|nr:L,D-transpeptidase family protein [Candidatus Tectomicrobia bacterium]
MRRWRRTLRALLLTLLICTVPGGAQDHPQLSDTLVGGETFYTVQPGDSLTRIGARFGVAAGVLSRENGLQPLSRLKIGQELRVDNRHIVPPGVQDGIIINLPQRLLFYFVQGKLVSYYPVGLGRPDWPTRTGAFTILSMEENPVWDVPKSIQQEMRRCGQPVRTQVLPGPDNPLGQYWLGLSLSGYGIHGTIAPASIYQFQSHGCIRLHPDDIADLFARVAVGTPGRIIYAPVLLAQVTADQIYLEVHRDVYKRRGAPLAEVQQLSLLGGFGPRLDGQRVQEVVHLKDGVAREVSRRPQRFLD